MWVYILSMCVISVLGMEAGRGACIGVVHDTCSRVACGRVTYRYSLPLSRKLSAKDFVLGGCAVLNKTCAYYEACSRTAARPVVDPHVALEGWSHQPYHYCLTRTVHGTLCS